MTVCVFVFLNPHEQNVYAKNSLYVRNTGHVEPV